MKIANGVEMLELKTDVTGHQMTLHPSLVWDSDNVVLIDAGVPGQADQIRAEMEKAGVSFDKLTTVILTHQDFDHIGSLPEIIQQSKNKIEVIAHEADKPYIEGEKLLMKMDRERAEKMTPPKAKVDKTVADQEELPYCGGIKVIYTPGHTPGHISLYLEKSKTLITGDAIVSENGRLIGPNPPFTPDMDLALQSIKKFTEYDIQSVICYHGGLCTDNVNQQLRDIVK
ncbi:MBL fold metallo-hydrolase [Scopulibacillus cellulosilyticus]|uniref:MBL fold metallo-hydrolase n=1 Tax=Scopulibacillus cellulosilyticus TaxID=2665665 RepID=A0ABW2PZ79_9BACL